MNRQVTAILSLLLLGNIASQAQPATTPQKAERARRYLGYVKVEPTGAALREAAATGRIYTIDLLLQAAVPIDEPAADGTTALMVAAAKGGASLVNHLLKNGASLDAVSGKGETALIAAMQPEDDSAFHALLDAGANVDLPDREGRRPLHRAIAENRAAAVEALLQAGAKVTVEGETESPLSLALQQDKAELIQSLIDRGAPPVDWTPSDTTRFWKAYRAGNTAAMDLLQKSHASPPALAGSDQPLLAVAVLWQDVDLVKLLLKWGADPEVKLCIPANRNFIETTGRPGLTFYLENEAGMTPLMLAAGMGFTDGVAALMEGGAHRTARTDHYKMVAQSFAGQTGNAESLQVLLGLSPRSQDQDISIKISIGAQMATVYQKGIPLLRTSISTGRKEFPTPTGRFVITDKHRSKISTIYEVAMPYFMRLSGRDFGMHEGYVPGYAASHGCIRLPADIARKLYKIAGVGTLVTIDE